MLLLHGRRLFVEKLPNPAAVRSTGVTMASLGQRRFVRGDAELEEVRLLAKARECPHCRRLGTINAHGFLRGYSESGAAFVTRGRRFFCSNRGQRPGCGRTFSILLASLLSRSVVTATTLTVFVLAALAGLSIASAWLQAVSRRFSPSTGFRLWRRIINAQVHLRSQLSRRGPPPVSQCRRPLAQLIEHMKMWVSDADTALFAGFQLEFQSGVFG